MSNCKKCGTKKCGCQDVPLSTIPQFQCPPNVDCPVPSPCDEYYDSACVYYAEAGIPALNIQPGDSLQSIIQRLVLFTTGNISCVTGTCQATYNIFPVVITSTTITIAWAPSATATSYQVEYKTIPGISWSIFPAQPAVDPTQLIITGLTPNTDYLVRVNSICDLSNCYSVILQIKTKP